jgi:hypothetical protein
VQTAIQDIAVTKDGNRFQARSEQQGSCSNAMSRERSITPFTIRGCAERFVERFLTFFHQVTKMTRNHFLSYGLILLCVGLQLLAFDSFILSENASKFYYEKIERTANRDVREVNRIVSATTSIPFTRKVIKPPRWFGWPFLSVGAVLVFQSFAMRRQ